MVILTRPDGGRMALNAVLIERVEAGPQTVVTLVDGTEHVVAETLHEVVERLQEYTACVLAATSRRWLADGRRPALRLLPGGLVP
jgi:flagellar protein FlbD